MTAPLVIGHRGASGYRPEHTLASYALAIEQGADYIEPDLVMTRDGVLVARHENEISGTTDVAAHPEFAARRRVQVIDDIAFKGWFTEDFTLAELRTLRARERLPLLRPGNTRFDGQFGVPTFAEILDFLSGINATRAKQGLAAIGVYPETKHPTHFASIGLALEPPLLATLREGARGAPVFIQSFETGNLRALRKLTDYPLVLLVEDAGHVLSPAGLTSIAEYANVLGAYKTLVIPRDAAGNLGAPTALVNDAHRAGLAVHCWTFRRENEFLPPALRHGNEPAAYGDVEAEIRAHVAAGIDGFFTDQPDAGRRAVATPRSTTLP